MSWLEESKEYTSKMYEKYEKLEEKRTQEVDYILNDSFLLRTYLTQLFAQTKTSLCKELSSDMATWYNQRVHNFNSVKLSSNIDQLCIFGTYFKLIRTFDTPNKLITSPKLKFLNNEQTYAIVAVNLSNNDFYVLYIGHSQNVQKRVQSSFHKNRPDEQNRKTSFEQILMNPNYELCLYSTSLSEGLSRDTEGLLIKKCKQNSNLKELSLLLNINENN